MPFFEGAHDFDLRDNKMNDMKGDYTVNDTSNVTNNSDSNNRYLFSDVSKGNKVTHTYAIGHGNGNTISSGPQASGAVPMNPQNISQKPTAIPAAQGLVAPQPFTQSATHTPAAPDPMAAIKESIASGTWTPEMISAFGAFYKSIQPVAQTEGKQPQSGQSQQQL